MKEIDLELYRWNWYKLRIKDIKANRNVALRLRTFWSEYGVFVSTLPRQSGKSSMIIKMAEILRKEGEAFVIIVPNEQMKDNLSGMAPNIPSALIRSNPGASVTAYGIPYIHIGMENVHLLIDEYQIFHEQALSRMLDEDWKSVSMTGTLKVRHI